MVNEKIIYKKFSAIYKKAQKLKLQEPTAMVLATASKQGQPSVRIILLKEFSEEGFVFFTNQQSQKGNELNNNPKAALCFYWDQDDHQIRVEGRVEPVSQKQADEYWKTRPRESQIGAWASQQSRELSSRSFFLKQIQFFKNKFKGQDVPRPNYWSGYLLRPHRWEFWKRKPFRLHERIVFEKKGQIWKETLLYP